MTRVARSTRGPEITSRRERAEIEAYLRWLADCLDLKDWRVRLSDIPATEKTSAAEVEIIDNRRAAAVHIAADFRRITQVEQRHVLVHELLHCHTKAVADMVLAAGSESVLGSTAAAIFEAGYRNAEEDLVDRLAQFIAPRFPTRQEWSANI